jgi:glutamine synthetase
MADQARINTVVESLTKAPRSVIFPQKNGQIQPISEIFGQNVFTRKEMAKYLPKPVYKTFVSSLKGKQRMDKVTADAIAHAVKVWAIERGATHFTHWFQPLNDSTAEKHDSFLTLKSTFIDGAEQVNYFFLCGGNGKEEEIYPLYLTVFILFWFDLIFFYKIVIFV